MALFSLNLNDGEELLIIIRRHFGNFFGTLLRFIVVFSVIGSIYYFIPNFYGKIVVIIVLNVLVFIFLIYKFIVWYLGSLVITNRRIIDVSQKSLTKRMVTEILLSDVVQVFALKDGILESILNVGTLVIEVKGGGKIVGLNVKDPEGLMAKINKLRQDNGVFEEEERDKKE